MHHRPRKWVSSSSPVFLCAAAASQHSRRAAAMALIIRCFLHQKPRAQDEHMERARALKVPRRSAIVSVVGVHTVWFVCYTHVGRIYSVFASCAMFITKNARGYGFPHARGSRPLHYTHTHISRRGERHILPGISNTRCVRCGV